MSLEKLISALVTSSIPRTREDRSLISDLIARMRGEGASSVGCLKELLTPVMA